MNHRQWSLRFFLAVSFILFSAPAGHASLAAVSADRVFGFPVWYEDSTGRRLELCLDPPVVEGGLVVADPCLLDGTLPSPGAPISFPDNFPDEAFWWATEALLDIPANAGAGVAGGRARLVLALEAAFLNGVPEAGQQMAFNRVRIRANGLQAGGTYTFAHPLGTESFVADGVGNIVSGVTRGDDFGCEIAPCDFSIALGDPAPPRPPFGPFLQWSDPDVPVVFPQLPGNQYIGDPLVDHAIQGSPVGQNLFRITGPGLPPGGIETALFSVLGKIFTGVVPATVVVDSSTYSRTAGGQIRLDIHASAIADAALDVTGTGITGIVPLTGDGAGKFVGHVPPASITALPAQVTVTANRGLPTQAEATSPVVDIVNITRAVFFEASNTLTIEASSSDATATLAGPQFTPPNTLSGGVLNVVITPPAIHPFQVTVSSSGGGSVSQKVTSTEVAANGEVLAVTTAFFTSRGRTWFVTGTSSVPGPGNTVTVYAGTGTGGPVIGAASVSATGQWRLIARGSLVSPSVDRTVTLQSSGGTTETVPMTR